MHANTMRIALTLLAVMVLGYSVPSLVAGANANSVEICCGATTDCPNGMGCAQDVQQCSTDAPGFCVPIPSSD